MHALSWYQVQIGTEVSYCHGGDLQLSGNLQQVERPGRWEEGKRAGGREQRIAKSGDGGWRQWEGKRTDRME